MSSKYFSAIKQEQSQYGFTPFFIRTIILVVLLPEMDLIQWETIRYVRIKSEFIRLSQDILIAGLPNH